MQRIQFSAMIVDHHSVEEGFPLQQTLHYNVRLACPGMVLLAISLGVVALANVPILSSFFIADDFLHFYQIANWRPFEFIFSSHGGHLYIFRNMAFYVMFELFGMHATPYFVIVLLTHLIACAILFKTLQLITGKTLPAAAGTMLWGTSPLLQATMGWYSVYGHVLTGLFFLLFFYDLVRVDQGLLPFSGRLILRWSIYIVLMATSFGHGLATAGLAPATAALVLWGRERKWQIAALLIPAVLLVAILYASKDVMFAMAGGSGPQSGPTPLSEATRFALPILEMSYRMGAYALYCATAIPIYCTSAAQRYPAAALLVSAPLIALFIYQWYRPGAFRKYYGVLALLLLGLIAVTAYGRAPFYSIFSVPIDAAAITPRYYYLILLISVLLLILMLDDLLRFSSRVATIVMTIVVAGLVISTPAHYRKVKYLMDEGVTASQKQIYLDTAAFIEASIQAAPVGKSVYIDNTMREPLLMFFPSETCFPGRAAVFAITYPDNIVNGRRVFFVEQDRRIAELNLAHGQWRISTLLVTADGVEHHPNDTRLPHL